MICARAFDPAEREYHRLSIMDNGELWYSWKPTVRHPIPEEWIVEWGFLNTHITGIGLGPPIYENDKLRIPWIKQAVMVRYTGESTSKLEVPRFLYVKEDGTTRNAFLDSRIENLGSLRCPTTRYERPDKPKPTKEPARLDIYAHLRKKEADNDA